MGKVIAFKVVWSCYRCVVFRNLVSFQNLEMVTEMRLERCWKHLRRQQVLTIKKLEP